MKSGGDTPFERKKKHPFRRTERNTEPPSRFRRGGAHAFSDPTTVSAGAEPRARRSRVRRAERSMSFSKSFGCGCNFSSGDCAASPTTTERGEKEQNRAASSK